MYKLFSYFLIQEKNDDQEGIMWLPDYVKSQEEAGFKGNSSNICALVLKGVRGCSLAACGQLAGRAAGQMRGYYDHRWT